MKRRLVFAFAAGILPSIALAAPDTFEKVRSALAKPTVSEQANALRALSDAELTAKARAAAAVTVVGGQKVSVAQFPWQAALTIQVGGQAFKCGGTLIARRYVLTAAHCLDARDSRDMGEALPVAGSDVTAGFGSDYYRTDDITVRVARVILHPGWKTTGVSLDNDAALLELASDAPVVARPIPLRAAPVNPADGELWVSGWGRTQTVADANFYGPLMGAKVTVAAICGYQLTSSMVCAGASGRDSCSGDSGGPLVAGGRGEEQLVGVVSWGADPCARDKASGVYTRTSAIADWVRTTTGNRNTVTTLALAPLFDVPKPVAGGIDR